MGYKNRIITLTFPDLADEGDSIHVVLRNPRLLPAEELQALAGARRRTVEERQRLEAARAALDAGLDIPDELVSDDDANRGFELVARLVVGWRVWDSTTPVKLDADGNLIEDEETRPRLLPLPATTESVGKLPQEILTRIMQEVAAANPPRSQEGSTSKTS